MLPPSAWMDIAHSRTNKLNRMADKAEKGRGPVGAGVRPSRLLNLYRICGEPAGLTVETRRSKNLDLTGDLSITRQGEQAQRVLLPDAAGFVRELVPLTDGKAVTRE